MEAERARAIRRTVPLIRCSFRSLSLKMEMTTADYADGRRLPKGGPSFNFMRVALGINMRRSKFPSIGLDYGYNGIDSDLQVAPL